MWYLRALAVAAVAVPLVVGTGCVTKQTYEKDMQAEHDKTVKVTRDLNQAKIDLKKAQDTIADLTLKVTDVAKLQQQLADERKRADGLQESIKGEVAKAKKVQERLDAEKIAVFTKTERALKEQLSKAHDQIAELKKEVDKLKKMEMAPPHTPPAGPARTPPPGPPTATPPVTPPASPK
jgi:hypothetical protein